MRLIRAVSAFLLCALPLFAYSTASSTAGTSADPLISKSYIDNTYLPLIKSLAASAMDKSFDAVVKQKLSKLDSDQAARLGIVGSEALAEGVSAKISQGMIMSAKPGPVAKQITLTKGTKLLGWPGTSLIVKSGTVAGAGIAGAQLISISSGTLINLGVNLSANNRYMLSEKAGVYFLVKSDNAVLLVDGYYKAIPPAEVYAPLYTDMAEALKTLGLFAGTNKGFELERTATRAEAIVMFIRLLGKEAEAAVCTDVIPFTDVPAWARPFVAYAYKNRLTYGVSATKFGSNDLVDANQYTTFVLRSLGYRDGGADFTYDKAAKKAYDLGVLTQREYTAVLAGAFYRDEMVYISFVSLYAKAKGSSETLVEKLVSAGVTDSATASAAMSAVTRGIR